MLWKSIFVCHVKTSFLLKSLSKAYRALILHKNLVLLQVRARLLAQPPHYHPNLWPHLTAFRLTRLIYEAVTPHVIHFNNFRVTLMSSFLNLYHKICLRSFDPVFSFHWLKNFNLSSHLSLFSSTLTLLWFRFSQSHAWVTKNF